MCKFSIITKLTDKGRRIFINGQCSFITDTSVKVPPDFTGSHKLKSFEWNTFKHLWEFKGLQPSSLKAQRLFVSRVARVIKPKVRVHWALNASPRCNKKKEKKKPFPRGTLGDTVLVESAEGRPSRGAINRPRLPSWMPFTFQWYILQRASKLYVRKRKPVRDQVPHSLPSSRLSSATALKTGGCWSSVCPHVLQIFILLDFQFPLHVIL